MNQTEQPSQNVSNPVFSDAEIKAYRKTLENQLRYGRGGDYKAPTGDEREEILRNLKRFNENPSQYLTIKKQDEEYAKKRGELHDIELKKTEHIRILEKLNALPQFAAQNTSLNPMLWVDDYNRKIMAQRSALESQLRDLGYKSVGYPGRYEITKLNQQDINLREQAKQNEAARKAQEELDRTGKTSPFAAWQESERKIKAEEDIKYKNLQSKWSDLNQAYQNADKKAKEGLKPALDAAYSEMNQFNAARIQRGLKSEKERPLETPEEVQIRLEKKEQERLGRITRGINNKPALEAATKWHNDLIDLRQSYNEAVRVGNISEVNRTFNEINRLKKDKLANVYGQIIEAAGKSGEEKIPHAGHLASNRVFDIVETNTDFFKENLKPNLPPNQTPIKPGGRPRPGTPVKPGGRPIPILPSPIRPGDVPDYSNLPYRDRPLDAIPPNMRHFYQQPGGVRESVIRPGRPIVDPQPRGSIMPDGRYMLDDGKTQRVFARDPETGAIDFASGGETQLVYAQPSALRATQLPAGAGASPTKPSSKPRPAPQTQSQPSTPQERAKMPITQEQANALMLAAARGNPDAMEEEWQREQIKNMPRPDSKTAQELLKVGEQVRNGKQPDYQGAFRLTKINPMYYEAAKQQFEERQAEYKRRGAQSPDQLTPYAKQLIAEQEAQQSAGGQPAQPAKGKIRGSAGKPAGGGPTFPSPLDKLSAINSQKGGASGISARPNKRSAKAPPQGGAAPAFTFNKPAPQPQPEGGTAGPKPTFRNIGGRVVAMKPKNAGAGATSAPQSGMQGGNPMPRVPIKPAPISKPTPSKPSKGMR